MTLPTIAGTPGTMENSTNATTHTTNYPAVRTEGLELLWFGATDSADGHTFETISDETYLAGSPIDNLGNPTADAGGNGSGTVCHRTALASEPATINATVGPTSDSMSGDWIPIDDWDSVVAAFAAISGSATGVTPTATGLSSGDWLVFVVACLDASRGVTTWPTGFDDNQTVRSAGNQTVIYASQDFEAHDGSDINPTDWTFDNTSSGALFIVAVKGTDSATARRRVLTLLGVG